MTRVGRLTIIEIAKDLGIGKGKVYKMLEGRMMPGLRVGSTWIVTREAYEAWKKTCGSQPMRLAS